MKTYANQPSGTVDRARQLRRSSTDVEKKLWGALREMLPEYKWRRQMPIGPCFVDFACFARKLVIELDGGHHSEAVEYDRVRARFIEAQGYRVVRFWNNEVGENIEGVVASIAEVLSPSPSRGFAAHPSPNGRGREARSAGRVRAI